MRKHCITALTFLVAMPVLAESKTDTASTTSLLQPKLYLGAMLSNETTNVIDVSKQQAAYGLTAGISLTPQWALEAQYLQSKDTYNERRETRILNNYNFNRLGGYVVYTYNFKQNPVFINAKLGYNKKTGAKAEFSNNDTVLENNISAMSYGIGLGIKLKQVDISLNALSYARSKTQTSLEIAENGSSSITRLQIVDAKINAEYATLLSATYHF